MLKCIIIDDEPLARAMLTELLAREDNIEIIATCANGFEGLKAIQDLKPDLIFLDVQMPKINGLEMLELLENPPSVIFVTAFDEFAVQAFEVNAIDYLLKPIEPSRLNKAIQKASQGLPTLDSNKKETYQQVVLPDQMQRVVVKEQGEIKIIPLDKIVYLEASDDYVKVHVKDRYYLKYQRMSRFEQQLPSQTFVRIHRSFIVNSQYIHKIELLEKDQYVLILQDGKQLAISKSGYSKLKSFLGI